MQNATEGDLMNTFVCCILHFYFVYMFLTATSFFDPFLPRCMECRHGLAMRILSFRLSVKRVHFDKTEEQI